jgi:hypothetical protein
VCGSNGGHGKLEIELIFKKVDFVMNLYFKWKMTKKGEISVSKTTSQIEAMLPPEMKQPAKEALQACKDVRKLVVLNSNYVIVILFLFILESKYKDPCDKTYYSSKCAAEFNPEIFVFP